MIELFMSRHIFGFLSLNRKSFLRYFFTISYFRWTRMLIESATGIFTGSKYNERSIFEQNGFLGELEPIGNGRTIASKNHGQDQF